MNNSLGRIKSNFTKYSELFYTSTKHTVSFHTKTLTFNFKAIGALRKSHTALDNFAQFSTLIISSNPANSVMSTETKCNGNEKKKTFLLVRKTKTLYPVKNNIKTYKELLYLVKK